ncbi:hypothetical protein PL71_09285 [Pseudoalteromonas distincta]|uniref:Uncharacterized protein n=1 Tax=Pseudoalteromonas distincta TaxID=77608 RepID=A0ABT9GCS9_9GAMM|nr:MULTISPECIES: hypothetical protein [Pseudoalteromonas distincta group]KHM49244.1 hypothetical protein PL71_09285 [Pseudoalteromonas elyakovii]KID37846.1 hypothetical protein QT16_11125 [Pseudoalteromonas distincta]MDP4483667.1 hypothetical protein [Pseudoalteromonas elyakovii]
MNELLIIIAMVSLLLMMLNIRKNTLTIPTKAFLSTLLFSLALICFMGVYGILGGAICTVVGAMLAGLLTAVIAGKAPQLLG